jgi:hypothetical protein
VNTTLTGIRKPTPKERRKGAEVVFIREDTNSREHVIYAATCHESWEQWGAITEILSDNVPTVEAWRKGNLEIKPDPQEDDE